MQGMHLRNMQIQELIYQNEELRNKIQGFNDLQQCADELLYKLEGAKSREIELLSHNDRIKKDIYELERQFQQCKNAHAEQMRFVIAGHDRIFAEKDAQIKQLSVELQQASTVISSLQRDVKHQMEIQRQLSAKYQGTIQKYDSEIRSCEHQIHDLANCLKLEKNQRAKDIQHFNITIRDEQRLSNQLKDDARNLTDVVKKLEQDNLFLADYIKELEDTIAKKQADNADKTIKLQHEIEDLLNYGQRSAHEKKELMDSNQIITKQLEDSKRKEARFKNENEGLYKQNQKLTFLLKDADAQISLFKDKMNNLEDAIEKQANSYKNNASKLIEENTILAQKAKDAEESFATAKAELRDSNQIKNTLQSTANRLQSELTAAVNDHSDCRAKLQSEKGKNQKLESDNKTLNGLFTSIKAEYQNLDALNLKLKKQMQILSEQYEKLMRNNEPNDLNKHLMDQINKMMISFKDEREDQTKIFKLDKEKQRQNYEAQLRQKDVEYMKEIADLRDQLHLNQQFEILNEKNNKLYTTFKY